MNIKKSFKVLTTATLISALSLSTVIPGAAQAADKTVKTKSTVAQKATQVEKIVVKTADGKTYVVGSSDYSQMKAAGLLNGATVQGVVSQEGKYYSNSEFAQAKAASEGDVAKAFELLSTEGTALTTTPVGEITGVDEDGKFIVDEITPPATDEDLKVVEIAAINATDANFTVKFGSDVTEADLKDAKLNLKGAQDLTASFVKLDGKTATYKVDTDIVGKSAYNGEYAISSTALKLPANLKTTYTAEIAGTFVEGFVFDDETTKPLAGATVTVDGKTTTTDANGYYKLAVTPGLKNVEISKGTEYFVTEAEAEVARNNATVVNKDLAEVNPSELYFTGTVLDSKDSKAVKGATVKLQAKNDKGEWEDVADKNATTETNDKGQFQFGNSDSVSKAKDGSTPNALTEDVLEVGKEYRAVVEKKVSASNLDDVYKKQEVTFTVSNKKPETTKLINADKVAELKSLNLDASVLGTATIAGNIEISFLDTDGATTLEELTLNKDSGSGDAAYTTTDGKKFDEKIDVVNLFKNDVSSIDDGDATKPRLVAGTYFMKVENAGNATKAYAVEVTEGGDVNVKFEFEVAKSAQTSTQVGGVQYDKALYEDPSVDAAFPSTNLTLTEIGADLTRTSLPNIQAQYAAYQTVAGKEIKISETTPQDVIASFDAGAVKAVAAEKDSLDNLAGSVTYTVKSTSNFLVNKGSLPTVTPKDVTNPVSSTLESATKLDSIVLTDKAGAPLENTNVTVKSLKLVDATGKVVAEATPNAEVTTDADGIVQVSALGAEATKAFTNIKPGKYKLTVEAEGYKSGTSTTTDLIDFQNGQIEVGLEANKGTEVTGYVRYTDGTNVAKDEAAGNSEASIIAYDKDGDAVAAAEFGETTGTGTGANADTTYSLTGLEAGKEYTFVVRGDGFETKAVKKTVTAEDITNLNFDVVKGGKGQFKLQIVDEKNNTLTADAEEDMTAYDAYYDKDLDNGTVTAEYDGGYAVTGPQGTSGTEARSYTINSVSVGSYTLVLADTNNVLEDTKYVLPQTYNLTLANINGTSYSTSNGTEIIKVPLVDGDSSELDVALNLTFTGGAVEAAAAAANGDIDYVQILDVNGNIVKTVRADDRFDLDTHTSTSVTTKDNEITIKVPNNATYTVKAYLNNGFVASDTVTVQNNDVKKTIDVDKSER